MVVLLAVMAFGFETGKSDHLEIKWMRDSVEYRTLTTQVFREAARSVAEQAGALKKKDAWAVVLDVDETVLDNSPYFLELGAYGIPYTDPSWDAWTERRTAEAVPGSVAFVEAVRGLGGRVAWISNRNAPTRDATVDNLAARGLWRDGDVMCLLTDEARTKRIRREELRAGHGDCAWEGTPVKVLAYLGDAIRDLPDDGEDGTRDADLGVRQFMLPNPMYGGFEHGVTWTTP